MTYNGLEIGEVAKATGLTVRTLHHYDRLGLLVPHRRSDNGHRVYSAADIERIYRVQALRRLGFKLKEMPALLDRDYDRPLAEVVDAQLRQVRAEIEEGRRLVRRLESLYEVLSRDEAPRRADLMSVIASTTRLNSNLRHDYTDQAGRYDQTRGASPSLVEPLLEHLAAAPGRTLWDVGGGTGNYAEAMRAAGWSATVVDVSPDMRSQAVAKGLDVLAGDACALPGADDSVDAVMMVSMLHQVEDWRQALREAARVLRPGGVLAVIGLTAEHLTDVTWAFDLFPSMRDFAASRRPSADDLMSVLPGCEIHPLWFRDLADASIAALCAVPESMLDERLRRQTSFFERMERDNPAELAAGLSRLRAMLDQGRSPLDDRRAARDRWGDVSLLTWRAVAGEPT